jgi:transposase
MSGEETHLDATHCFIATFAQINMFRALLCPSSGAHDYTASYNIWSKTPWLLVVGGQVQGGWLCFRDGISYIT